MEERNIGFNIPGHQQGKTVPPEMSELLRSHGLACDVTEVLGIDDIHNPRNQCLTAQELAAEAWGSERCYFLVNGSTVGNQAMFMSVLGPEDTVILPRSCHRSVFSALVLSGAHAHFIKTEFDDIMLAGRPPNLDELRLAIQDCPQAKALFLTSPTYHGATPDLPALIKEAHRCGLVVLVDEAWGAHLAFHDLLPTSALEFGADLVCQSVHKMTSALTQSALLHSQGDRVSQSRLKTVLTHLQTSSPSSLLVASIDCVRRQMVLQGELMWSEALNLAEQARRGIQEIPGLLCHQADYREWDGSKLLINATELGYSGYALAQHLRTESRIQVEMWEAHQVLLLVLPGHTADDVSHLLRALRHLPPRELEFDFYELRESSRILFAANHKSSATLTLRESFYRPQESIRLLEAVDRMCAELLYCYPPGIPLVHPGQRISEEILEFIRTQDRLGSTISGAADSSLETVLVLEEL